MKLLHVVASMDPKLGGVSQAVRTIVAGLAEQAIHNEVVSLDSPGESWHPADSFLLHAVGPGRGPWSYSAKLIPWLLANLSRFDAVILHGLWLYHGYALRQALRRFKQRQAPNNAESPMPRLFVMPHGMLDPYFQRATGRRLKAWRNWAYWKALESGVVNDAAGLLFTCETERLLAHEPFTPYHPQQEIVVGLGVEEPPPYTPAMRAAFLAICPELQHRPYLLFLSRIHEKKGVEALLQAYKEIIDYHTVISESAANDSISPALPPIPALVIAGPGLETPYGQRMRQLAAQLPEVTPVFFAGLLTGDAKWGAFYHCEAFVLPSHQENFGIAVVEALACGKPVLISDQVNIWREIEAAHGGLVAPDTAVGTEQLLARWSQLRNPEKQLLGQGAQLAYQKHFTVSIAAEKMIAALAKKLS